MFCQGYHHRKKDSRSPVPNAVVGVYLYVKQPTDDDVNERDIGILPLSWHFCLDGTISRSHG